MKQRLRWRRLKLGRVWQQSLMKKNINWQKFSNHPSSTTTSTQVLCIKDLEGSRKLVKKALKESWVRGGLEVVFSLLLGTSPHIVSSSPEYCHIHGPSL